jgi:hypothetical protein
LLRLRLIADVTSTAVGDLVREGNASTDAAELAAPREELAETKARVEEVVRALERLVQLGGMQARASVGLGVQRRGVPALFPGTGGPSRGTAS